MMKFFLGLGLGICFSFMIVYSNSSEKITASFMGFFVGISVMFACLVFFIKKYENRINNDDDESKDDWWKNGSAPPWHQ